MQEDCKIRSSTKHLLDSWEKLMRHNPLKNSQLLRQMKTTETEPGQVHMLTCHEMAEILLKRAVLSNKYKQVQKGPGARYRAIMAPLLWEIQTCFLIL